MKASFRTFIEKIVDYAGLFPPASLSLEDAVERYASARQEPASLLVDAFICPAMRLAELEAHAARLGEGDPWRFSVLGRGGETRGELSHRFEEELGAMLAFRERWSERVLIPAIETRMPLAEAQAADEDALAETFADLVARADAALGAAPRLYFELPAELDPWGPASEAAARALKRAATMRPKDPAPGLKLRCGGTEPRAFPSVERVALTLLHAARKGVPLKATAGLHHPLRSEVKEPPVTMHGFFNVFVGGLLALEHDLDEGTLIRIVDEREAEAFVFEEESLGWRDLRVSRARVAEMRRDSFTSFGSCSIDEPFEDLEKLGLVRDA